jgi:phenol hydroxylase P3 protein
MDKRVEKKKHSLGERYAAMSHDLNWETTYQPMDKVFPADKYEGIKVHDWDKWQDPFRLTMDSYWKYQGEKEKKLYAVIDAFAQNNGQFGVSDARYVNALKLFIQAVTPQEYYAHRSFANLARNIRGDELRVACQMQAADELRHFQNQTHTISNFNKYFNGMHNAPHWFDHAWYLSAPKSFSEDVMSAGPFERLIAISFSFDALLTKPLFVSYMSGAAHNGDLAAVTVSFSGQSDETRHMTTGIEAVKFLLAQDAANLPIVQRWIDKWFWRGYRVMTMAAMMHDYMLTKHTTSWKEAWEMYVEPVVESLFAELAVYGLRKPKGWAQACDGKEHISHQAWNVFYGYNESTAFHTWLPEVAELDWLSKKYPNSFDRYYRPRLEHYAQLQAQGERFSNHTLPMQCQTCQMPMIFTEQNSPRWIAYRETQHQGETFHFCSDHCEEIFTNEPEKYVQANLPVHQILQGHCFNPDANTTAADFNATSAVLDFCQIKQGRDNDTYPGSEDDVNFTSWGGGQDPQEAQL